MTACWCSDAYRYKFAFADAYGNEAVDIIVENKNTICKMDRINQNNTIRKVADEVCENGGISKQKVNEIIEEGLQATKKTSYGKSSDKIGDFTNLEGSTVDDILDRIPDDAVLRELRPVQGGATEGFEFKWIRNGQTYRVRVHNADPSAPVGTNAYNGWVVRVQRGKWYYDPTINDFREARYFNPTGPYFDETIVNNTHIPIHSPYDD